MVTSPLMMKRVDERVSQLRQRRKDLPDMQAKLTQLTERQQRLERTVKRKRAEGPEGAEASDDSFEKKRAKLQKLTADITTLKEEIDAVSSGRELMNYWMDAAPFLLEYEQEKKVEQSALHEMKQYSPHRSTLCSFLNKLPTAAMASAMDVDEPEEAPMGPNGPNAKNGAGTAGTAGTGGSLAGLFSVLQPTLGLETVQHRPTTRYQQVLQEYLAKVEHEGGGAVTSGANVVVDRCIQPHCRGEMCEDPMNEQFMICSLCGCVEQTLAKECVGTYKEPVVPIQAAFAYQKINHFRDWLAKSQGKENSTIPTVVYDALLNELRKRRIVDANKVTRDLIHELLKKLKMSKYYHNISQIHYHLTGKYPPQFTAEEEAVMMDMFEQLEPVYAELKPADRENFFSYEYCIRKFCQIQAELSGNPDWTRNIKYFKLLKGTKKLYETEQLWKACCKKLGWKFIKSM